MFSAEVVLFLPLGFFVLLALVAILAQAFGDRLPDRWQKRTNQTMGPWEGLVGPALICLPGIVSSIVGSTTLTVPLMVVGFIAGVWVMATAPFERRRKKRGGTP